MDIKASKGNDTDLSRNSSFTTINHYSFENTEQTFIELASEQRLSILFKLSEQDTKLSKLAKDLNVTMQEVHRNVNRLMDVGLVKKKFRWYIFSNNIWKYHNKANSCVRLPFQKQRIFFRPCIRGDSNEIRSKNWCTRQF